MTLLREPSLVNSAAPPFLFAVVGREDNDRVSIPHAHARGQLFGASRGVLTVGVEDAVWVVPSIHAVWLPPHVRHWGHAHGCFFEGWAVYVAEDACAGLPAEPRALRASGLLREAVLRVAGRGVVKGPLDDPATRVALVILDEIRSLPTEPLGLPMPRDRRMLRIAEALLENPGDGRDMAGWMTCSGASMRTISRLFVAETGFTLTAWRQRVRLLRSLEMLATDGAVTTIAMDLGFSSASAFITLFREAFGETPAVYRRQL